MKKKLFIMACVSFGAFNIVTASEAGGLWERTKAKASRAYDTALQKTKGAYETAKEKAKSTYTSATVSAKEQFKKVKGTDDASLLKQAQALAQKIKNNSNHAEYAQLIKLAKPTSPDASEKMNKIIDDARIRFELDPLRQKQGAAEYERREQAMLEAQGTRVQEEAKAYAHFGSELAMRLAKFFINPTRSEGENLLVILRQDLPWLGRAEGLSREELDKRRKYEPIIEKVSEKVWDLRQKN